MAMLYPETETSDSQVVSAVPATMTPTMGVADTWLFVSSTDCWIAQGATPTAAAADGSMFVPANVIIHISGRCGAKLSVIQASAGGTASLTRALVF